MLLCFVCHTPKLLTNNNLPHAFTHAQFGCKASTIITQEALTMCDQSLLIWPVFTLVQFLKYLQPMNMKAAVSPPCKTVSLKGENKARLWSNVKWCRVLNVGTLVSVRAWLEGVVCKAVQSGEDPVKSAGWEQAHLPPVRCCSTSQSLT